jgi:hypothetical protein
VLGKVLEVRIHPPQGQPQDRHAGPLTSLLGCLIVRFAHEPAVFHEVELVSRGQLPLAHDAGEAMQVVYEVLGAAHHLRGRYAQLACGTLGPEAPAGRTGRSSARRRGRQRLRPERVESRERRAQRLAAPALPLGGPAAWAEPQELPRRKPQRLGP